MSPPVHFARWAHVHRFLSVRLSIHLSVWTRLKIRLEKIHTGIKILRLEVKDHMGQGHIRIPYKGRWAHNNVKLLHLIHRYNSHVRMVS